MFLGLVCDKILVNYILLLNFCFCYFQVKALYVKNIPENVTTEQLKELFRRHGEVTKVVMPPGKASGKRDFGFIHYAERSSALKAVKETEKYEIDGTC
jgi:heterogeneous nuclear ribonucleoprotein R